MRRTLFLCLALMASIATFGQSGARGIAVLPFSISTGPQQDQTEEMTEYAKKIGVFLQEAFYNSFLQNGDTLQSVARTNKLFSDAGIEPDQPYWLDKTGLCILLKVKYVIAVQVTFGKGLEKAKAEGQPDWFKLANDPDKSRGFRLEVFSDKGMSAWDYKENFSWNQMVKPNTNVYQQEFYAKIKKQIEGFLN